MIKDFSKDSHTILHGDIIEILKSNRIKEKSVDLIFADPPYNIGKDFNGTKDKWESINAYKKWFEEWLLLAITKLKPNGSMYVMAATQYFSEYDIFLKSRITVLSRIVWTYDSAGVQAKKSFGSLYEPILYCVNDKNNYTFNAKDILIKARTGAERKLMDYRANPPKQYSEEKLPGNVWHFNRVRYLMNEYEEHPTQKPEVLLERIIKVSSNKNDVILDLFAGSFTTAYIAKKLERNSISIELDEEFMKIGLRRLGIRQKYKNETLKQPLKPFIKKNTKAIAASLKIKEDKS